MGKQGLRLSCRHPHEGGERLEEAMYTNAHPLQSCFNEAALGCWGVPWVLGKQAWWARASCWHRSFNYFTLS